MQKEIEIDKEKLKNYTHLSLDNIKQYLKSVIYENADKKLISKLIINTFIREVIYYPDRIIITYNFTDKNDRPKVTKKYLEQIEKQSEKSQAVYSIPISSSILNFGAPKTVGIFDSDRFYLRINRSRFCAYKMNVMLQSIPRQTLFRGSRPRGFPSRFRPSRNLSNRRKYIRLSRD